MTHSHRKHLEREEEDTTKKPSANNESRRPHKNLVRYWQEHSDDYDEIDDFFAK